MKLLNSDHIKRVITVTSDYVSNSSLLLTYFQDAKLSVTRTQTSRKERSQELDEMDIVSTAFVILVAGYDTTSQVLSYAGICRLF